MHSRGASFELALGRDYALVATVRRFVGDMCLRVLDDADATSRVVIAAHELLDNAVRYASRDESNLRVTVQCSEGAAAVVIETTNRANEASRSELVSTLERIHASGDRAALYQGFLRQAAQRPRGKSGLGLGRVHAESELDLTSRFEDGVVQVRAEGHFSLTKGALVDDQESERNPSAGVTHADRVR